jgi:integrase
LNQIGRTVVNVQTYQILAFFQDFVGKPKSTIRAVYASLLYFFRLHRCEHVMQSSVIRMFVKGAQNLAPVTVKKLVIWDPELPLRYIASRPRPTAFLPAAREALLLLLLATGIRVDCASKMSKCVTVIGEVCYIPYLLARKTGESEPQVVAAYPKNERICPVRALSRFLALAKLNHRTDDPFLFISSRGIRASIDTLRHWVTFLLNEAGVKATAGSCRSASTSAANEREMPIDQIMQSAGWAKESTFRRYYQRRVSSVHEKSVNLMPESLSV